MRLNLFNNIDQEVDASIMRSKPKKALLPIITPFVTIFTYKKKKTQLIQINFNFLVRLLMIFFFTWTSSCEVSM